jgi:hypothetical protein
LNAPSPKEAADRGSSLLTASLLAIAVVAVALADGGYGGVALGIVTLAVWLVVAGVALFGRPELRLPGGFLVAAALLLGLTALAAFSLGWSPDPGAGFTGVVRLALYSGFFVLCGLLLRPGAGSAALTGIGAGLVAVSAIAVASRLIGLGPGDTDLVAEIPPAGGRLSFPLGYWNALGAVAAMAVPVLVWLGSAAPARRSTALSLAGFVPVLLAAFLTSSRGALVAAALGAVIAIAASPERPRAAATAVVGVVAALPAIVAAALAPGIVDSPWAGFGGSELVVCSAFAIGVAAALAFGPAALERAQSVRIPGLDLKRVVLVGVVLVAGLIIVVGPGRIAGDFAATQGREATGSQGATLTLTGSGRAQYWDAALSAFTSAPAKGIGEGGYETWWNREGALETPANSAHSEPLELLAELGPLGAVAFLAFFAVVAWSGVRRVRDRGQAAPAGAALGLVAVALVGFLIDWTWDLPAVAMPVLAAAAALTTRALGSAAAEDRSLVGRSWVAPPAALAGLAALFAIPAIWAGGVLAVTSERLDASDEAMAAGRFDDAANTAREAAAAMPWSSAPWLRLATIEQAAGNLEAATDAARMAVRRSPDDFRPWLWASLVQTQLGNDDAAVNYATRAGQLAPLILPRAVRAVETGSMP